MAMCPNEDPEVTIELARSIAASSSEISPRKISRLEALAGDASTRKYFRLYLESEPKTCLLVKLSSSYGPLGGGPEQLDQTETFLRMRDFLNSHGFRVPQVYLDARDRGFLLVEDLGAHTIGDLLAEPSTFWSSDAADRYKTYGDSRETALLEIFRAALQASLALQKIPQEKSFVCYQRRATQQQLYEQASEISDYLLKESSASFDERKKIAKTFEWIAETVFQHPKVLSHYDFMPFNLIALPDRSIALLDFQDASQDSPARDLVSLLNDRGTDQRLGAKLHFQLLNEAMTSSQFNDLSSMYQEYLFHWDCRVSGRFAQLAQKGREHYRRWIPSTLQRLGRTALLLQERSNGAPLEEFIETLSRYSSDFSKGLRSESDFVTT